MPKLDVDVNVHHVTRIEGHGNIVVKTKDGKLVECRWEVPEAPRFFEAMVVGRKWNELNLITSRICGICSIGHQLASLKATEAALGIKVSEQTYMLRQLLMHAENLQSHVLHVGYLVLPDLAGVGSVIPLAGSHTEAVLKVVGLHRLANELSDYLGGRTTHPMNAIPGGFAKLPEVAKLSEFKKRLADSVPDLKAVAELVKSLAGNIPKFTRETEFIALVHPKEYAMYDGKIGSTDFPEKTWNVDEYLNITNEYIIKYSTAKRAKHNRVSYMVGALARFNLNASKLTPLAKTVAGMFGLEPCCHNPYMNSVAQVVEAVWSVEDSLRLIEHFEKAGIKEEKVVVKPKAGRGVGAVEVPRGILFHDYTYDAKGVCTKANCIIPTNQNHENIERDFEALVPLIKDKPLKQQELTLEMLVRAYDPCVSCSTHLIQME
jgi:coenzyme F420-reducing hydrogenase alpha subunit